MSSRRQAVQLISAERVAGMKTDKRFHMAPLLASGEIVGDLAFMVMFFVLVGIIDFFSSKK